MYKKLIATITAGCFLFSFVFAPTLQGAVELRRDAGEFKKLSEGFALPHSAGRITGGRDFGSSLAVVSVQDLHCHGEVQRNISRILSALDGKYRIRKVYVEGASGPVDTSWLSGIKDEKLKSELVETLVDEGRLTGAEYYAVSAGKSGILSGLEDEKVYAENLARLGEILSKKEEFAQAATALRRDLAAVKKDYFGRENKRFDTLREKHRNERISAFKYYHLLTKYAEKQGGTDDYPNITGYLQLMEAGKHLHYKQIARQLQEYMRVLKERLPFQAYNLLLEKTDNFSKLDEMYLYLSSLPRQYRAGLSVAYPQLAEFLAYTDKSRSLNPLEMVREEKRLVSGIRRSLSRNTAEKEVAFLADFSGYFEDYLNNRLSAEDYRYFADNFDTFKLLWPKYAENGLAAQTDDLKLLDTFYRVNLDRNACFVRNIAGELAGVRLSGSGARPVTDATLSSAQDVIVVVTGGFHTLGLEQLLAGKKITYVSVTPNVTQGTKTSDIIYSELAWHQANILSQAFALHVLSNCDPAEKLGAFFTAKLDAERKLGRVLKDKDIAAALADISRVWDDTLKADYGEMSYQLSGPDKLGDYRVMFTFAKTGKSVTMDCNRNGKATFVEPEAALAEIGDDAGFIGKLYDVDGKLQVVEREAIQAVREQDEIVFRKGGKPLFVKDGTEARVKLTGETLSGPGALQILGNINAMDIEAGFKRYIRTFVAGQNIQIIEDNGNIRGFHDGKTLFISESLSRNPVALFHELGEGYFGGNKQVLPQELQGISVHTYLRGCGQDVREAYKTIKSPGRLSTYELIGTLNLRVGRGLTEAELTLIEYNRRSGYAGSPLDGLQDKVFGAEKNWQLSRLLSSKAPEAFAAAAAPEKKDAGKGIWFSLTQAAGKMFSLVRKQPIEKWFDSEMTAFFEEMQVKDSVRGRISIAQAILRLLERYMIEPTPSAIKKAAGIVEDTIRTNKDRVLIDKDTYVVWVQGEDMRKDKDNPESFFRSLGIGDDSVHKIMAATDDFAQNDFLRAVKEMPKNRKVAVWINAHGWPTHIFLKSNNFREAVAAQTLAHALSLAGTDLSRVTLVFQSCYSYNFTTKLLNHLSSLGVKQLPTVVTQAYRDEVAWGSESFPITLPKVIRGSDHVAVKDILSAEGFHSLSNPTVIIPTSTEDIARVRSAFDGEAMVDARLTNDNARKTRRYSVEGLNPWEGEAKAKKQARVQWYRSLILAFEMPLGKTNLGALDYGEDYGDKLDPGTNAVEGFMGKVYDVPDEETRELQHDGVKAVERDGSVYFEKEGKALYTKDGSIARVELTGRTLPGQEALSILGDIDAMDIPAGFRGYIRTFVAGQNIQLIEDNENIRGFHDGKTLYIAASLAQNPVALFHELGEGYFNGNEQVLPRELQGINIHTYLRGCGQDVRDAYEALKSPNRLFTYELLKTLNALVGRGLTISEMALIDHNKRSGYTGSPLDGLQDRVFGSRQNRQFSKVLSTPSKRDASRKKWSVFVRSAGESSPLILAAPALSGAVSRTVMQGFDRHLIAQAVKRSTEPLDRWFDREMTAFLEEMRVTDSVMARNSISLAARRLLERYMLKPTPSAIKKATKIVEDTIRANKDRVLVDKDTYVISVVGDDEELIKTSPAPFFRSLGIRADSLHEIKPARNTLARIARKLSIFRSPDRGAISRTTKKPFLRDQFLAAIQELPKDRNVAVWVYTHGSQTDDFYLGGIETAEDEFITAQEMAFALSKAGTDLSRVTIFLQTCYSYEFTTALLNHLSRAGVTQLPTVVTATYRKELSFGFEALATRIPAATMGRDHVTVSDILDMQRLYRGSNPTVILPTSAGDIARIKSSFAREEKLDGNRPAGRKKRAILTGREIEAQAEVQKDRFASTSPDLIMWDSLDDLDYGEDTLLPGTNAVEGFMGKVYSTPDEETRELKHDGVKAVERDGSVYFEKERKALYTKDGSVARVELTEETLSGAEALKVLGKIDAMDIPAGFKEYIHTFVAEDNIRIIEDNENIRGFHDGKTLYIEKSLAHNPVALFHELGEGYFGVHAHKQMLPRGVGTHTYLRGCGQDARNAYEKISAPRDLSENDLIKALASDMPRALTPSEKALIKYNRELGYAGSPLDGLQDKVFGARKNRQLSGVLSLKVPAKKGAGTGIWSRVNRIVAILLIIVSLPLYGFPVMQLYSDYSSTTATRVMMESPDRQAIDRAIANSNEPLDKWFDGEMTAFFEEMQVTDSIMARNSISMAARRLLERYMVKPTPSAIKKATTIVLDAIRANKERVLIDKDSYVISITGDDPRLTFTSNQPGCLASLGINKNSIRRIVANKEYSFEYDFLKAVKDMPKDRQVVIWIDAHGAPVSFYLGGEELSSGGGDVITERELAYALVNSGHDLSRVTIFSESCYSYHFATNLLNRLSELGATQLPFVVSQAYRDEVAWMGENLSSNIPEVTRGRTFVTVTDILEMQRLYYGSNPAIFFPAAAGDMANISSAFDGEEKVDVPSDPEPPESDEVQELQEGNLVFKVKPDLLLWDSLDDLYYNRNKLLPETNVVEGFMGKVYDMPDKEIRELQRDGVTASVRGNYVYFEKGGKALYTKDGSVARVKLTGETVTGRAVVDALGNVGQMDIPQAFREYIDGFRGVPAVQIIEDNENIRGFHDGSTIYITRSIMQDPVALFHELGEGYFGAHEQLLPRGVGAHTYLRGCGKGAREAYRQLRSPGTMASGVLVIELNKLMPRPLTAQEISLIMYNRNNRYAGSPLDGLQDKVFGSEENERLSVRISGAVPEAHGKTVQQGVASALDRSLNPLSPVMRVIDGMNTAGRQAQAAVPAYAGKTLYDFNGLDEQEEDFLAKAGMNIVRVRAQKMPDEPVHRFAFPLGTLTGRFASSEGIDESGLAGIAVWIDRLPAVGGAAKYVVSFDCPLLSRMPDMTPEDAAAVRARAFFALTDFLNVNKEAIAITGKPLQPDVVVFGENEPLNAGRETLSREAAGDRAAEYAGARIQALFDAAVWVARLRKTPDDRAGMARRARGADLAMRTIDSTLLGNIESKMKRKYAESAVRAQQDLFVRVNAGRGFDGDDQKLTGAARIPDTFASVDGQGKVTLQLRNVFDGDLAGIREDCIDRSAFPPAERVYEDRDVRVSFDSLRRRYAPLLSARARSNGTANELLADEYVQVQGYEQLRRIAQKAHAKGERFVIEYAPDDALQFKAGAARIAAGVKLFGIDGVVLDLSSLPDGASLEAWAAAVRQALPETVLAVKAPVSAGGTAKEITGDFSCMRVEEWGGAGELPLDRTGDDVLLEVSIPENADAAMLDQIASRLENVRVGNISIRYVSSASGETAFAGDARQLKAADILRFFSRLRSLKRDPFTRGFAAVQNVREADIPVLAAGDLAILSETVEIPVGGTIVKAPRLYALDRVFRTIEAAGHDGGKLLETEEYLQAAKKMIESIPGFENKGWKFAFTEIAGALSETEVTAEERAQMNRWLAGFYRGLLQRMAVKQYCLANERTDLPFADNGYRDRETFSALLSRSLETMLDGSAPIEDRAELSRFTRIAIDGVSPAKEKPGISSPAHNVALDPRDPASIQSYLAMLEGMVSRMRNTSPRPVIEAKVRPYLVPLLGLMRTGSIDRPGSIAALLRIYQLFDNQGDRLSLEAPAVDNLNLILGTKRIRSAA